MPKPLQMKPFDPQSALEGNFVVPQENKLQKRDSASVFWHGAAWVFLSHVSIHCASRLPSSSMLEQLSHLLLFTSEMQRMWLAENLTPSLFWKNELEGVNASDVKEGKR